MHSGVTFVTYSGVGLVAQVSNLLYRGFLIRNRHSAQKGCRLEVGDTAGWKPALRDRPRNTSPNLCRATLRKQWSASLNKSLRLQPKNAVLRPGMVLAQ